MIDNKHIECYFNYMKSREIISDGWIYNGYVLRNDKIIIRYYHQTIDKMGYISQKNSSYAFSKETLITELRDFKLRKLFD